jgi:fructose-1,6-bisphosphatase
MYADNVVIWASTKNNAKQHKTLEQTMNTALNSLSKWATENNMEINASKTVYQFFSMRHKNDNFDLKINSQKLPKSESTKYLGVHMDNELSWKNHMEHTINKVNQRQDHKTTCRSHMGKHTGHNEHHIQNIR